MTRIYVTQSHYAASNDYGTQSKDYAAGSIHEMPDHVAAIFLSQSWGITASDYEAQQAKANAPAKEKTTPRKGASSASIEGAADASA